VNYKSAQTWAVIACDKAIEKRCLALLTSKSHKPYTHPQLTTRLLYLPALQHLFALEQVNALPSNN
jgi:hypothetical protein